MRRRIIQATITATIIAFITISIVALVAFRQLQDTQRALADAYLQAMGHSLAGRYTQVSTVELETFKNLSGEQSRNVRLETVRRALRDPETAERVVRRSELFAHNIARFDPSLREAVNGVVIETLRQQGQAARPSDDFFIRLLAVQLGLQLRSHRLENGEQFPVMAFETLAELFDQDLVEQQLQPSSFSQFIPDLAGRLDPKSAAIVLETLQKTLRKLDSYYANPYQKKKLQVLSDWLPFVANRVCNEDAPAQFTKILAHLQIQPSSEIVISLAEVLEVLGERLNGADAKTAANAIDLLIQGTDRADIVAGCVRTARVLDQVNGVAGESLRSVGSSAVRRLKLLVEKETSLEVLSFTCRITQVDPSTRPSSEMQATAQAVSQRFMALAQDDLTYSEKEAFGVIVELLMSNLATAEIDALHDTAWVLLKKNPDPIQPLGFINAIQALSEKQSKTRANQQVSQISTLFAEKKSDANFQRLIVPLLVSTLERADAESGAEQARDVFPLVLEWASNLYSQNLDYWAWYIVAEDWRLECVEPLRTVSRHDPQAAINTWCEKVATADNLTVLAHLAWFAEAMSDDCTTEEAQVMGTAVAHRAGELIKNVGNSESLRWAVASNEPFSLKDADSRRFAELCLGRIKSLELTRFSDELNSQFNQAISSSESPSPDEIMDIASEILLTTSKSTEVQSLCVLVAALRPILSPETVKRFSKDAAERTIRLLRSRRSASFEQPFVDVFDLIVADLPLKTTQQLRMALAAAILEYFQTTPTENRTDFSHLHRYLTHLVDMMSAEELVTLLTHPACIDLSDSVYSAEVRGSQALVLKAIRTQLKDHSAPRFQSVWDLEEWLNEVGTQHRLVELMQNSSSNW